MIKTINSDILLAPVDVITHGCNCFHVVGGGIARILREAYPEIYEADLKTIKGDKNKLGTISIAEIRNKTKKLKYIYNSYTQYNFGGGRQLNYEAIYCCFEKIKEELQDSNYTLGIPHGIGCGLAGGNVAIVNTMIQEVFKDYKGEVLVCKNLIEK